MARLRQVATTDGTRRATGDSQESATSSAYPAQHVSPGGGIPGVGRIGLETATIPPRSPLPFTGVGMRKRAAFYSQLARMMQAGIGVGRCLNTLAGQRGSRRLARAAADMARHVEAGNRLAEAFGRHPNIFLPNEVRVIEGASRAGREPDAMLAIARLLDRLAAARNKVLVGLIYPVLWMWAAFLGIPLLIAWLSPLAGPDAVWRELWWQARFFALVAAVLFAVVVAFRSIPRFSGLRTGLHGAALFVPLFGKTYRRLALARFADAFHGLYVAGVMAPEALERAAAACGNDFIAARILGTVPMVTEGTSVSAALAQSGVIPTLGVNIVQTGEMSGKLDESLVKFAEYQHEDLEIGIERLAKILPMAAVFLMIIILAYRVLAQWGAHISGVMDFFNQ
ncbi:MAG: hypothetical protein FJ290_21745 [Planctomycetes bacterium]|nr:hypothetical protein [Planctomycetota bacterium]